MTIKSSEILINASLVTPYPCVKLYEFVLNSDMEVIECMQIHSLTSNRIVPVHDYCTRFHDTLFELNHVRINPTIDNTFIIFKLSEALENIGVEIKRAPHFNEMAQCYRPLGEIMENVRFYFDGLGNCTFLCSKAHLKLVKTGSVVLPLRF